MNIEDLLTPLILLRSPTLTNWESELTYSFLDQFGKGIGFTEKQALAALRVLTKYQHSLSAQLKQDIGVFLANPSYKFPFRKLNTMKKMSIHPHGVYGRAIKVEFPFNPVHVDKIRAARPTLEDAQWNKDEKAWIFPLTENSIQFLSELVKYEQFDCDEEFQSYLDQCDSILDKIDHYVPMLVLEQNTPTFKNISQFLPELSTTDVVAAMFEARRYGISTWSEEVSQALCNSDAHPVIKEFLESDPLTVYQCDSEKFSIDCIADIVDHLSPCMFVIPGGNELATLQSSYEFLTARGINDKDISVMFRLDTAVDAEFNSFVKEKQINSSIGKTTKVVFVSGKIPKPVLQSNIKFNSIINLGISGVHYTIRDFLGFHENLINYTVTKNKKDTFCGHL